MCHYVKMCHELEKNGNVKIGKDGRRKWSKNDPPIDQRGFKVGERDVSKNACVLSDLSTCKVRSPLLRGITSLFEALFSVQEKKRNLKSLLLSFSCPFSFHCI